MSKQIKRTVVAEQDITILKACSKITGKDIRQAY